MLDEMEDEAATLFSAGEFAHALAEFSVLREIRARREGPYSVHYLKNLHDCVRCMSALELWADSTPLCRELHGKYRRTHGPAESDTVDVAKHWAWASLHLQDYPLAVRIYLTTADALWDADPEQARRLLAAAVAHRADADVLTGPDTPVDGRTLRHGPDVWAAIGQIADEHAAYRRDLRPAVTFEGLSLTDSTI